MSRALSSELLKLRTTRTFYALVGSALGLVLLIVCVAAATGDWTYGPGDTPPGLDLLGVAAIAQLFAVVLGILAVTSEFRHGTITPSLLVVPSRERLLSSKLIVHLLAGLLFGILTVLLTLVLSALIFSLRDIETGLDAANVIKTGGGTALSIAFYATLGVGIGAVVRNQVGAIVGTLAYLFVIESLLTIIPGLDDAISKFGLNGVASGLANSDFGGDTDTLAQIPAGLLLLAYCALFAIAGAVLLKRRDISA
ncbi:ABC transporter permease [Conexibacter sp. CPCC 206217]|uniref:ABC transporter permease n=1 Tax=Conexibacter sp. CPCC 206217 TaxID=3064574 RepID=UPI00271FBB21|nr:ABC transporter permease [Conexibacter sp. CPCC 206217]MDO8209313.1 ABC transporter permease [Conexibacter sp. CPCC 206217]